MAQYMSGKGGGALKTVNGRLDVDRSLHQDRFANSPSSASSSQQVFRQPSQRAPPTAQAQAPFDLSSLRQHLSSPPPAQQSFRPIPQSAAHGPVPTVDWAAGFNVQQASTAHSHANNGASGWQNEFMAGPSQRSFTPPATSSFQSQAPWQRPAMLPTFLPQQHPRFTTFPAVNPALIPPSAVEQRTEPRVVQSTDRNAQEPLTDSQDILARTAESFVNQLEVETAILRDNPKLGNSDFMKLVRGIGNRDVVVEEGKAADSGERIGEGARFAGRSSATAPDWANEWAGMASGPAIAKSDQPSLSSANFDVHREFGHYTSLQRAPDFQPSYQPVNQISQSEWDKQFLDQEALIHSNQERPLAQRRKSVHFDDAEAVSALGNGVPSSLEEALHNLGNIPGAQASWQEDLGDDLDFDEETFYGFNGPMQAVRPTRWGAAETEGWKSMDSDWSKYLQDMKMSERADHYLFQAKNPYTDQVHQEAGSTSPTLKGVLELEAEVQNDPSSWEAWYALGLKQQENEREEQAILALSKTIQLEPDYRPTYLALAVSYTNEGQKEAANTMLERWIDLAQEERRDGEDVGGSYEERRQRIIERLIDMARQSPEEVDADIQVALGVMFNASEEYEKAEDCFFAALSVNPDDWLLYNRLGATMANSGRSSDAVELYQKALSLHPNFVRAHFNLGIAHSNLGQFPLAAQSILNALRLQHADATEGYAANQLQNMGSKGVTSSTLWNTLRMACQKQDLATLANNRDLSGFPMTLEEPRGTSAESL